MEKTLALVHRTKQARADSTWMQSWDVRHQLYWEAAPKAVPPSPVVPTGHNVNTTRAVCALTST